VGFYRNYFVDRRDTKVKMLDNRHHRKNHRLNAYWLLKIGKFRIQRFFLGICRFSAANKPIIFPMITIVKRFASRLSTK
jgi:hypothetical protein